MYQCLCCHFKTHKKTSLGLKYHRLKMQIMINQTNLPPAMISTEIPLWKVKMLRWQFVICLQTYQNGRGKRRGEGGVSLLCGGESSKHIGTQAIWSQGARKPESLSKGPSCSEAVLEGWRSMLLPASSGICVLHLFLMLWIFLGFLNCIDQRPGKIHFLEVWKPGW